MSDKKRRAITFYSYKGGSGRSTTLVNTALHLMKEELLDVTPSTPLLIVDTDIESAGLTYFFGCEKRFNGRLGGTNTRCVLANEFDCLGEQFTRRPTIFRKGAKHTNFVEIGRIEHGFTGTEIKELGRCAEHSIDNIADAYSVPDLADTLAGLTVPTAYIDVIRQLEKAVYVGDLEKAVYAGNSEVKDKIALSLKVKKEYPLDKLMTRINAKRPLSDEDTKRFTDELLRMLPSPSVVDVSEYFGKPVDSGYVYFLGVDVFNPKGTNNCLNTNTMNRFVRIVCGGPNRSDGDGYEYRAVIFDSGAGTQDTAHILHTISDVIVYCLRPSQQFANGTAKQLKNYQDALHHTFKKKKSCSAVLLPTCVPTEGAVAHLCELSVEAIKKVADDLNRTAFDGDKVIDTDFCTMSTCLNEVEIFKCHEMILSVQEPMASRPEIANHYRPEDMPDDAKRACGIYNDLARAIIKHTDAEEEHTDAEEKNAI